MAALKPAHMPTVTIHKAVVVDERDEGPGHVEEGLSTTPAAHIATWVVDRIHANDISPAAAVQACCPATGHLQTPRMVLQPTHPLGGGDDTANSVQDGRMRVVAPPGNSGGGRPEGWGLYHEAFQAALTLIKAQRRELTLPEATDIVVAEYRKRGLEPRREAGRGLARGALDPYWPFRRTGRAGAGPHSAAGYGAEDERNNPPRSARSMCRSWYGKSGIAIELGPTPGRGTVMPEQAPPMPGPFLDHRRLRRLRLLAGLTLLFVSTPAMVVVALATEADWAFIAPFLTFTVGLFTLGGLIAAGRSSFHGGTKIWQNDGLPGGGAGGA